MKEFKFPDVGEGIHEGTIVKWHVKEGETVKADQKIVDVETDKAIVELPSPASGTILKINFHEGTIVKVGETLVAIGEPGEKAGASQAATPQPAQSKAPMAPQQPAAGGKQPETGNRMLETGNLAAPSTRRLARELSVDIAKVRGTGPAGRITDADVKAASGTAQPQVQPEITKTAEGDIRIPLNGIRKVIAERMTYSKTHIPHACGMDLVDVTRLVIIREKEKQAFQTTVHLTYLSFIIKACTVALRKYPSFNAHFDAERNELIAKREINIGIAVATPDGLVVPVIRNADRKSIIEIAGDIERLAALARGKKLKLDDVHGGTFTITNVGSVGGMFSTPVIDPPQVAIVGVHRIRDMPMVVEGRIEARKVMGISMCFDHRVADGAVATEFMNVVKLHLEDPDLLLVDMS